MFGRLWKRRSGSMPRGEHPVAPPVTPAPRLSTAAPARLFSHDTLGATIVVTIIERNLTANRVADLLYELKDLLARNEKVKNLVLDLQNVDYLDSAGLNMLVVLFRAIRDAGGNIAIASAKRAIEVLFKLTRLDNLFPVQRDVLGAIAVVERPAAAA